MPRKRPVASRAGLIIVLAVAAATAILLLVVRLPGEPAEPATPHKPVAVFLGDSYTEAGQVKPNQSFVSLVSNHFGWSSSNLGQGGTGYVTAGPVAQFPDRGPFTKRASKIAPHADYVIVAGGINDMQRNYPAATVRTAVARTLSTITKTEPRAKVFVVGPFWPNGFPTASAMQVENIVRAEAQRQKLPFIDPIGEHWITGSNDGMVKGNRAKYIGPDGTHPTVAGQAYIAAKIIDHLSSAGVTPYRK